MNAALAGIDLSQRSHTQLTKLIAHLGILHDSLR